MKTTRLIFPLFFAAGIFAACSDTPTEAPLPPDPDKPVTPDKPDEPSNPSTVVSPVPDFNTTAKTVGINLNNKYQTMEGFGASDCWLPAQIGKYWTSNRRQLAQWLFSKNESKGVTAGIGLSMWRINLGAGSFEQGDAGGIDVNNRAECYLTDAGVYDWNKCEGQRYFMNQAKAAGVESYVLFSNSPLVRWTKNGKGYSQSGANANLKDDCYDDFATYMAEVADHFNSEGYNITHISPVNEPQYNWDGHAQEGSGWKNSEVAKLVKELNSALESKNSTTKILIPEAGSWEYLYQGNANDRANQIDAFWNPSSANYIGDLSHVDNVAAGHSYWLFDNWSQLRDTRTKAYNKASSRGLRTWQTEWSMLDKEPSELGGSYDQASEFDIAFYMAKVIHNDIVAGNCSSWSYWTSMSVERYSQKNRFMLIKTTPSGGNYSDDFTTGGNIEATHNLWVLGNFSRFIRPGYQRIALSGADSKEFCGSAYVSPDGKTIVAVYANADKNNGITLENTFTGTGTLKSVKRYTTTEKKNLFGEDFNPADKVFVEPYSVSTIVYTFE